MDIERERLELEGESYLSMGKLLKTELKQFDRRDSYVMSFTMS